jgi:hypothetical protein
MPCPLKAAPRYLLIFMTDPGDSLSRGTRLSRVGRSIILRHLRFDCGYSLDLVGHFAFRIPSIICALHSRPDPSAIAEQLTEPDGNSRGNGFVLVEDIVEMLAGDPKQGSDLALSLAGRRDHILA